MNITYHASRLCKYPILAKRGLKNLKFFRELLKKITFIS